jgi:hypothetical protein
MKVFCLHLATVVLSSNKAIKEYQNMTLHYDFELPKRTGAKPTTTPSNPHMQLDQQPKGRKLVDELMGWAFSLPDISKEYSKISVPGAQAMCMSEEKMCTHCNAFMVETEFAHFHPAPDGSMHLGLPQRDVKKVIELGWGELHPVVHKGWLPPNFIMVYAPRNEEEADEIKKIIFRSYQFAMGEISD